MILRETFPAGAFECNCTVLACDIKDYAEFYAQYLESSDVLEVFDFDPAKAARVKVVDKKPLAFLDSAAS